MLNLDLDNMENFQKNIAFLFEVQGLTYSQMGRMAGGVAHTTVRDWHLKGTSSPAAGNVQKLAHALGLTTDELLSSDISVRPNFESPEAYLEATVRRLGVRESIRRLLQGESRPATPDVPLPVVRVATIEESPSPKRPKANHKRADRKDSPPRKR